MLRESFALEAEADAVELAVRRTWAEGVRTADGAPAGTRPSGTRAVVGRVMDHLSGSH